MEHLYKNKLGWNAVETAWHGTLPKEEDEYHSSRFYKNVQTRSYLKTYFSNQIKSMEQQIPTEEQVDELMAAVLKKRNVKLNPEQKAKLRHACVKSYVDNPDLGFNDLITAANIYLNFILDFPTMKL